MVMQMQGQCLLVLLSTQSLTSDVWFSQVVIILLVFRCKWQMDIVIVRELKMFTMLPCKKHWHLRGL